VRGHRERPRQFEQRGDPGGVVIGALRGEGRRVAIGDHKDRARGVALGERPDVLQGYDLTVDRRRKAVDVRLEAGLLELLDDPQGEAVVGVGAGHALGVVGDDGAQVGGCLLAVERHGLEAELRGVGSAQREQRDHDEDERHDQGGSIHLEVGQGGPPWACRASYQTAGKMGL
jgi:hypothetical protein